MPRNITGLLILFFLIALPAASQTLRHPVAASPAGTGVCSARHTNPFSFIANPAALAVINQPAAGIYAERRFLLQELNNCVAVIAIPAHTGSFGFSADYYGFSAYNETQLGLAYGRKLGDKIDAGVQFTYHGIKIAAGYGSSSAISAGIGLILHCSERMHAGLYARNPTGAGFGKSHIEKLPAVYGFGAGYDASEKFFVSAEIEKEEDLPVSVNVSFEYKFIPQCIARGGILSATSSAWVGLGFPIRTFLVDVTCNWHPQLGITPGMLLLFTFRKKEN